MTAISINGIEIAYEDSGEGPALVLVHGHPFNRSMWQPQVQRFSRSGWRVVAPDLRGYGESTVVPGKTPITTFAEDIVGLLDRLGLERVVVAGLSMGGQIVMEVLRLIPHRVAGLVLADTTARAETAEGWRGRNEMADRLLREGMGPYAEEVLSKMVAPYNVAALPEVAGHVMRMMRSTDPEGAAAALRGRAERPDYLDVLASAAVPALVVVGRDDEFTPIEEAELMRDRLPDAELVVIEGTAHMPNLERPAEFNRALEQFLARSTITV